MPRSGTKLIRALLNNHSKIAFSSFETDILPYWVLHWHNYGNLKDFDRFLLFYENVKKTSFFTYMKEGHSEMISAKEWHQACRAWGVAEVFEALIRLDTNCSPDVIWGEKSPSYIKHIPLLKKIYPNAKIIHIIRDVRDYCLSINHAWGKNMLRAAQRWQDDTAQCSIDISKLGEDGFEIRFEDLLSEPVATLKNMCSFLEIPYEEKMDNLEKSFEPVGQAKGARKIIATNNDKWRTHMHPTMVEKVEKICVSQLSYYDYPTTYKGEQIRISRVKEKYYRLLDGLNLIITNRDNRGIFNSLLFYYRDQLTKMKF